MTLPEISNCGCNQRPRPRREWRRREDGLEEALEFQVGYRCPLEGPRSHGQHGMQLRWLLRGSKGAAQFVMYTDWPPSRPSSTTTLMGGRMFPMAADLGYHARRAQYDGQEARGCDVLDSVCFYDGSGLQAERVLTRFFAEGEEAIYRELFATYEAIQ